jgi:hypothetical protein
VKALARLAGEVTAATASKEQAERNTAVGRIEDLMVRFSVACELDGN